MNKIKAIYTIKVIGWLSLCILAHFDKLGVDFPYRQAYAIATFILFLYAVWELLDEIVDGGNGR